MECWAASLGMAQLNIIASNLKSWGPDSSEHRLLNRIRLKHQEADVVVHVALPKELFPWAVKQ